MQQPIAIVSLTLLAFSALAAEEGSQYRNWCTRSADVERIAQTQRTTFIQECIDTLVEADKNPDASSNRRKRKGDDEG